MSNYRNIWKLFTFKIKCVYIKGSRRNAQNKYVIHPIKNKICILELNVFGKNKMKRDIIEDVLVCLFTKRFKCSSRINRPPTTSIGLKLEIWLGFDWFCYSLLRRRVYNEAIWMNSNRATDPRCTLITIRMNYFLEYLSKWNRNITLITISTLYRIET